MKKYLQLHFIVQVYTGRQPKVWLSGVSLYTQKRLLLSLSAIVMFVCMCFFIRFIEPRVYVCSLILARAFLSVV
jgi:hypothetical protein